MNVLGQWLADSGTDLGDVGTFGGRSWLLIDVGGKTVGLNADTKRAAVDTFVRDSAPDPNRP